MNARLFQIFILIFAAGFSAQALGGETSLSHGNGRAIRGPTKCPTYFANYATNLSKDGLLIKNRAKTCSAGITRGEQFPSAGAMRAYLESQPNYAIGRIHSERIARCAEGDSKEFVAQYYYYLNRLEDGAVSALEEIGSIDALLGGASTTAKLDCVSAQLPQVAEKCKTLKSCPASDIDIKKLAQESIAAEEILRNFDREVAALQKELNQFVGVRGAQNTELWKNLTEKMARTRAAKSVVQANLIGKYPWLKGSTYLSVRKTDPQNKNVEAAIRSQLQATRSDLVKSYERIQNSAKCVAGTSTENCSPQELKQVLSGTAELPLAMNGKSKDNIAAYQFMEYAACVDEANNDFKNTNKIVNESVTGAGLTVLTAGLAPIAMGARAATTAKNLNVLAKSRSAVALVGLNAANIAPDAVEVQRACFSQEAKLQEELKKPRVTGDQCPGKVTSLSQASQSYSDCVVATTVAALNVVPGLAVVPAAVAKLAPKPIIKNTKKVDDFVAATKRGRVDEKGRFRASDEQLNIASQLSPEERAAAAERVLKDKNLLGKDEKLTDTQVTALNRAHEEGAERGFNKYSSADLRKKIIELKKGGFSDEQANLLLRNGVAGQFAEHTEAYNQLTSRFMKSQSSSAEYQNSRWFVDKAGQLSRDEQVELADRFLKIQPLRDADRQALQNIKYAGGRPVESMTAEELSAAKKALEKDYPALDIFKMSGEPVPEDLKVLYRQVSSAERKKAADVRKTQMSAASAEYKQEQQGLALATRAKSGGDATPWSASEKVTVENEIKLMAKPAHELSSAEVKTIRDRYEEIVRKEQWSGSGQSGLSLEDQAVAQKFKDTYGKLKSSWADQDTVALAERQGRLVAPVRTTVNNNGQAQSFVDTRAKTNFQEDSLVVRRSLTSDVFPSRALDEPYVRYHPVIRSRLQMATTISTFSRWGVNIKPDQLGRLNVMTSIDGHSLKNAGFNVEEARTFLQSIPAPVRQQIMQSDDQSAKQLIETLEHQLKQQRAGDL